MQGFWFDYRRAEAGGHPIRVHAAANAVVASSVIGEPKWTLQPLPPEINSGRMYSGAGSGPMWAAASAWQGLGAELSSAGTAYRSVVSDCARSVAGSGVCVDESRGHPLCVVAQRHRRAGEAGGRTGQRGGGGL